MMTRVMPISAPTMNATSSRKGRRPLARFGDDDAQVDALRRHHLAYARARSSAHAGRLR